MRRNLALLKPVVFACFVSTLVVIAAAEVSAHSFGVTVPWHIYILTTVALTSGLVVIGHVFGAGRHLFIGFIAFAFFMSVIAFASKWPGARNALAPALLALGFLVLVCIRSRKFYLLAVPILALTLAFIVVPFVIALIYPDGLNAESVFLIRQSDPTEAIGWLIFSGQWVYFLALFTVIFGAIYFLRGAPIRFGGRQGLGGLLLLLLGLVCIYPGSHSQAFVSYSSEYDRNIGQWRAALSQREGRIEPGAIKKKADCCQKHIVVIGEALSRRYMSSYGYHIDTTPFLSSLIKNDEAVAFTDVISPDASSQESLEWVLTLANTRNKALPYQTPSIIEALKHAGYQVSWLSNQNRMGKYDTLIAAIAEGADNKHFLSLNLSDLFRAEPDAVLLPHIENQLKRGGNQVIFVHLAGQHALYADRYPDGYYVPEISRQLAGKEAEYATAVKYGDDILAKIITLARQEGASSVVFFSDHGEIVGRGHSHAFLRSVDGYQWGLVEVPLVVWLPPGADPDLRSHLAAGRGKPFMLDDLPHLLFDLYGVQGRAVDLSGSPINPAFVERPRRTAGGTLLYTPSETYSAVPNIGDRRGVKK